jgi:transcriptional regulator with XRE-family HTH domain
MDLARAINDLLTLEGITQEQLAYRAGVSQATVSRAMKKDAVRSGRARARLCKYMQGQAATRRSQSDDPVGNALAETWDGSPEHAQALAILIRASRELWPILHEETDR